MTLRHALLASLSLTFLASAAAASTLVIRDSIGADSSLTDVMVGVIAHHDGADWTTPGLVVNAPTDGELTQARFVIFARGPSPVNAPENNLANIYGYPMEFHIWSDGIEVGADSFDENPRGFAVPGHIDVDVNTPTTSFISIEPFGHTGPTNNPNMFTTFLVTIDLTSFNIAVESGTEYVMGIFQDNEGNFITGGGFFRVIASKSSGFEDVVRAFNTSPALRPGYVDSQHNYGYEQFGGSFTLAPFIDGDFDFDNDVDGADFLQWQAAFGSADSMADGNDDGIVDGDDLAIWASHFGETSALSSFSETRNASLRHGGDSSLGETRQQVPEPAGLCLTALAALLLASAHRTSARLGETISRGALAPGFDTRVVGRHATP